ncbi:MAG: sigma-70 family RNA polymerase sigma factor [Bdellovibrionota bacterium]
MRGNAKLLSELVEAEKIEQNTANEEPSHTFQKLPPDRMEALILEHREHGRRLAWSFLTTWRVRLRQDEVISIVGAALCEAANRFDESRGVSFKTFFFYHLRGMLLKEIARMINEQRVLQYYPHTTIGEYTPGEQPGLRSSAVVPVEQNNPERLMERKETAKITWEACAFLDDLEQEVILRHFVYDQPLIDIADELNYCRCHISRVKSRGLAKLQKHLRKAVQPTEQSWDTGETRISPEARAAVDGAKKSYTGGRGRRRQQAPLKSVGKLPKVA